MIYREQLLSKPVCDLLDSQGFDVYTEVPYYRRSVDIVAIHRDHREVVTVELKLSVTNAVIAQALKNQAVSDHAYVAIQGIPNNSTLNKCEAEGIGVISVTQGASFLLRPKHRELLHYIRRRRIEVAIGQMKPGGVAGRPCNSMCKVDAVKSLVEAFVTTTPGVSWQTIWSSIPNDYKSPNSLAAAMHRQGLTISGVHDDVFS